MKSTKRERSSAIYLPPWRIDVLRRPNLPAVLADRRIARAIVRALDAAAAPEPGSVTVVLTDDEELADLNHEHMGHEGATDVLSFPMLEPATFQRSRSDPAPASLRPARAGTGSRARTHIGDIAISVERAIEQAEQGRGGHTGDVRWSPADELRLLVTHGTLHLCGWDHADPTEEQAMRALEQHLLGPN